MRSICCRDAASSDYETPELASISSIDDAEAGPVIALVNALLEQAIADGASDLHVEPNADNIAIRVRIDGVLHDMSEIPLGVLRPLVSRLKILGDLDIAQNRARARPATGLERTRFRRAAIDA